MMASTPISDKEWEAQNDARTIAETQVITKDKKRYNAAIKAAQKMAAEKTEEAKAMKGVAKRKKK